MDVTIDGSVEKGDKHSTGAEPTMGKLERWLACRRVEARAVYERGFSLMPLKRAAKPTPDTLTTLKRTPGMSLRERGGD